jgi:hypothetical protein
MRYPFGASGLALITLALTLIPAAGCGPSHLSLDAPPPGAVLDYQDTLDKWTASGRIYQDFETNAVVHATFFSPEFVAAYLQEYDRLFSPVEEERTTVRNRLMHRQQRKECFFVTLFTGERDWNDLSLPNSIWRAYLITGRGQRAKADSITDVKRRDAARQHFFPHFESFHDAYEVCFDRYAARGSTDEGLPKPLFEPGLKQFSLMLTSPIGVVELTWQVSSAQSADEEGRE